MCIRDSFLFHIFWFCACSAPHAELHYLSTSINGRRRYRLDQSTPSLAAIVRRSSTQCRRPRTLPPKLPRSSHESSHARLSLYPPRTSHFTITPLATVPSRRNSNFILRKRSTPGRLCGSVRSVYRLTISCTMCTVSLRHLITLRVIDCQIK